MTKLLQDIEKLLSDLSINIDLKLDILNILKTKSEKIQTMFYYRIQGYTFEEIGKIIGCVKSNVKQCLERIVVE
jgi:hypothetical protein